MSTTQYCREGAEYCDFFFLFKRDFVDRDVYTLSITFPDPQEYLDALPEEDSSDHTQPLFAVQSQVTSIDPAFTRFEIAFKYLWLVITLVVMFCPCGVGFMSALKRQRKDTGVGRTFHQKWTAALLWGLLWFDDPFVALTVSGVVFGSCWVASGCCRLLRETGAAVRACQMFRWDEPMNVYLNVAGKTGGGGAGCFALQQWDSPATPFSEAVYVTPVDFALVG